MARTKRQFKVYEARISFPDGEEIVRGEWAYSKADMLKTLRGIYDCDYKVIVVNEVRAEVVHDLFLD